MKLPNVLMAAWVATTAAAASNQDNPSSLDNEVRYLLIFAAAAMSAIAILLLTLFTKLFQNGSRQGMATDSAAQENRQEYREAYIDSNGEASYYAAENNFQVCGEDQETCHYWGDDGLWNYYCAAVSFISVPQLPYSKCFYDN